MKKLTYLLILGLILSLGLADLQAQKLRKRDLKAMKAARKEAKKARKDGWFVPPGSVPMDVQFENAWKKEFEVDDEGNPKYLVATAEAVAGTNNAADQAAMVAARNELANNLAAKVSELIETKRANDQIDQETANTLDKTISNSKTLAQAKLTNVKTAYKIYQRRGKNIAVQVKILYDRQEAFREAKEQIRKNLEKESDDLGEQLDDILGLKD